MSEASKFYRAGTQFGSNYPELPEATMDMWNDYYSGGWQIFHNAMRRSDGAATYGDNGYFNEFFGADIMAGMMSCKNTYTAIGTRPYNHVGVRIAYAQADYGMDGDVFKGIGWETAQDGRIGASKAIPVLEVAEPYKEVPFPWDYGLGLMAVEGKDDVSSHKQYAKMIATSYANAIDLAILRPIGCAQPTIEKDLKQVETSLQGLNRMISGYEEIGTKNRGVDIATADMVTPYGGAKSDLYDFRSAKKSPFDGQLVNADGKTMDLDLFDSLWTKCMVNWDEMGNPSNKMWCISHNVEHKLSSQFQSRNLYLDSVSVQRSFAGVKTVPGREGGILIHSYHNIPCIVDGNVAFDFKNATPYADVMGDVGLYDLDHIWMSMLTPVSVYSTDNIAITRELLEKSVIHARMETRIDKFIGSGRIINMAYSA